MSEMIPPVIGYGGKIMISACGLASRTVTLETDGPCGQIDDLFENLIFPALLALGYTTDTVSEIKKALDERD